MLIALLLLKLYSHNQGKQGQCHLTIIKLFFFCSIFNSDEPSMSSDLAFIDRPSSSTLDSTFISRKRDTPTDFDDDADMMQTSELSPQPKRTRPFQFN